LRRHILETNKNPWNCNHCDKIFDTRCNLEKHLLEHTDKKDFRCDCGSNFFLKRRLNKHIRGHSKNGRKFCNYFNNDKECPFFKHENAGYCNFQNNCDIYLCQFNHEDLEKVVDNVITSLEEVPNVENDIENVRNYLEKANDKINSLNNEVKEKEDNLQNAVVQIKHLKENKTLIEYRLRKHTAKLRTIIKETEEWTKTQN
jgi:uncharacterized protein YoxC